MKRAIHRVWIDLLGAPSHRVWVLGVGSICLSQSLWAAHSVSVSNRELAVYKAIELGADGMNLFNTSHALGARVGASSYYATAVGIKDRSVIKASVLSPAFRGFRGHDEDSANALTVNEINSSLGNVRNTVTNLGEILKNISSNVLVQETFGKRLEVQTLNIDGNYKELVENVIPNMEKRFNGSIASTLAAGSMVYNNAPGDSAFNVSMASYGGQAGVAFNIVKRNNAGNAVYGVGISTGTGGAKPAIRIAAGWKIN